MRLHNTARNYFRKRGLELASPTTRALTTPLAAWARQKIRLEGRPFSFEGHEYLRAIYDDQSSHVVLSKAAQIGGTTWALLRSLHACLQGLNVGYYFPTRTDVLDFSRSRVGPFLAENPFLARRMADTDTVGLKRIGDANLYFRGMKSSVGMKSIPLDMLVFDELNEATPEARELAMERIAHSQFKRVIELSNPSLPNYGIDEQYERSDQRHWTLECGCGAWTSLEKEFPAKLGREVRVIRRHEDGAYFRACRKCGRELDLSRGEWVAEYPDRPVHGYRISQLFSPMVDPGEILEEYRTTRFPDKFYNFKIGVPWADLERRLDPGTVLALRGTLPPAREKFPGVVMGVDTGKDLHVVVLRRHSDDDHHQVLVDLVICRQFGDLDALMAKHGVERCVIDGLPETHATREFAGRHRGKVFLCFFQHSLHGAAAWDTSKQEVRINRTEVLDASRAIVREKNLTLPRHHAHLELFAKHMSCDAKVLKEDAETGAKEYRYIKTAGENHFSLAFTYALTAASKVASTPAVAFSTYDKREEARRRLRAEQRYLAFGASRRF